MRTQHDVDRLHALYEQVFRSCDVKRDASEKARIALESARNAAEDTHADATRTAASTYQATIQSANTLEDDIETLKKELVSLVAATNLRVKAVTPAGVPPGNSVHDIRIGLNSHEREVRSGVAHLRTHADRIRSTRSRWWFLFVFRR